MIVNDRKTTNFTTLEYFASKETTDEFSSSRGRRRDPIMHILPLRARECVFSCLLFFFRSSSPPPIDSPCCSSDILLANIVFWTNSCRFGLGKLDYGSSRTAQTRAATTTIIILSTQWGSHVISSCSLLTLHAAWTKHTHTKQHKEELCIKCRSNIRQARVTVASVTGFLGAVVMCSKVWDLPDVQFLSPTYNIKVPPCKLLLERPDLNILHEEILLHGEHGIPEGFAWMTPAVIKIPVQPKPKFTTEREEHIVKWKLHPHVQ